MSDEDRTVWVALNGGIYNFRVLRSRLDGRSTGTRLGRTPRSASTRTTSTVTALIVHLNVVFDPAIWDTRSRALLLCLIGSANSPFYYWIEHLRVLSEVRALLGNPAVPASSTLKALDRYLPFESRGFVCRAVSRFAGGRHAGTPGAGTSAMNRSFQMSEHFNGLCDDKQAL
jgi:asparagine synthase (glutamine-hydrolysing)